MRREEDLHAITFNEQSNEGVVSRGRGSPGHGTSRDGNEEKATPAKITKVGMLALSGQELVHWKEMPDGVKGTTAPILAAR
jgi:hypothetical protein